MASEKSKRIEIEEKKIKTVRNLKYLGVILDDKLTWNKQIEHIANKTDAMMMRVATMCWRSREMSIKDKMRMYNAVFFRPLPTGHRYGMMKLLRRNRTLKKSPDCKEE